MTDDQEFDIFAYEARAQHQSDEWLQAQLEAAYQNIGFGREPTPEQMENRAKRDICMKVLDQRHAARLALVTQDDVLRIFTDEHNDVLRSHGYPRFRVEESVAQRLKGYRCRSKDSFVKAIKRFLDRLVKSGDLVTTKGSRYLYYMTPAQQVLVDDKRRAEAQARAEKVEKIRVLKMAFRSLHQERYPDTKIDECVPITIEMATEALSKFA